MHNLSSSVRAVEAMGQAPERDHPLGVGLSAEVVETILNSRDLSMRKLYALKRNVFTLWCRECQLDTVNCPLASVLEFLQDHFSVGLSLSTLKDYMAAIAALHAPLSDKPLGKHQLVVRFL